MPYKTISDLPPEVRHALPEHAQRIYMAAFNSAAQAKHPEEASIKIAWGAVKRRYTLGPRGGMWVEKPGQKSAGKGAKEAVSMEDDVHTTDFATNLALAAKPELDTWRYTSVLRDTLQAIRNSDSITKIDDARAALIGFKGALLQYLSASRIMEALNATPIMADAEAESADFAANLAAALRPELEIWVYTRALRETLEAIRDGDSVTKLADAGAALDEFVAEVLKYLSEGRVLETAPNPPAPLPSKGSGVTATTGAASPPSPLSQADTTGLKDGVNGAPREEMKVERVGEAGAKGKLERVHEFFPIKSGCSEALENGDYRVRFLCHGVTQDQRRYYPKEPLEKAVSEGIFDGVKMFVNHSDPAADKRRGHRDLNDWGAVIVPGSVQAVEGDLEAVCHPFREGVREMLSDDLARAALGLSWDGFVRVGAGTINKKKVQIVEAIQSCNSVDFVPEGNARGRVLEAAPITNKEVLQMELSEVTLEQLLEARPDLVDGLAEKVAAKVSEGTAPVAETPKPEVAPEDQVKQAVAEATKPLSDELTAMRQREAVRLTADCVSQALEAIDAKPTVKAKVEEKFAGQILDAADITAKVTEAVELENAYRLELLREAGVQTRITGAGTDPNAQAARESRDTRMREALREQGKSEAEIDEYLKVR